MATNNKTVYEVRKMKCIRTAIILDTKHQKTGERISYGKVSFHEKGRWVYAVVMDIVGTPFQVIKTGLSYNRLMGAKFDDVVIEDNGVSWESQFESKGYQVINSFPY